MKKTKFQINLDVDERTYAIYNSLSPKQKSNLRKVLRMIIAAAGDLEELDLIPMKVTFDVSDNFKKVLKEVIGDSEEMVEAIKLAHSILSMIVYYTKTDHNIRCVEALRLLREKLQEFEYLYKRVVKTSQPLAETA